MFIPKTHYIQAMTTHNHYLELSEHYYQLNGLPPEKDNDQSDATVQSICALLLEFQFATKKQLETYVNTDLTDRLPELLDQHIINRFVLVDNLKNYDDPKKEALCIYTLDYGGRQILTRYYDDPKVFNWYSSIVHQSPLLIAKHLMLLDVFLQIKPKIKEFRSFFKIPMFKDQEFFDFAFKLKEDGNEQGYVGDIVLPDRELIALSIKRIEHFQSLVTTKAYRKIYPNDYQAPKMLFIIFDKQQIPKIVNQLRYQSDKKIQLSNISFMWWHENDHPYELLEPFETIKDNQKRLGIHHHTI